MTYMVLSLGLLVVALAVRVLGEIVARRRGTRIPLWPTLLAAGTLVILTIVFDTAMIASGLFAYSDAHRSGLTIGLAPIEDLSYPLALALLIPGLWELIPAKETHADAP